MLEHDYVPSVDISQVEDFMVEIAEHNARYGKHMSIDDMAVKFKKMFRKNDNRIAYVITFNEMKQCLSAYDCSIDHPSGNYINVYKGSSRVAQVGFPGWSKEVSRNAISTIRKSTGLTAENGYDAQVFFKGADPLNVLIGEYEEPLRRLADR